MNPQYLNRHQQGIGLVELMVALAIGVFLSLGAVAMYSNVRAANMTALAIEEIEGSGRVVTSLLTRDLRLAGYRPSPFDGVPLAPLVLAASGDNQVTVQYRSDENCFGVRGTDFLLKQVSYVEDVTTPGSADGTLTFTCSYDGTVEVPASPLIGNVSAVRFLYGIDTDSDGAVDIRVPHASIGGNPVLGVTAGLLLTVPHPDLPDTLPATTMLAGHSVAQPTEGHLVVPVESVVTFRNLAP